jgi:hypothetical protein
MALVAVVPKVLNVAASRPDSVIDTGLKAGFIFVSQSQDTAL